MGMWGEGTEQGMAPRGHRAEERAWGAARRGLQFGGHQNRGAGAQMGCADMGCRVVYGDRGWEHAVWSSALGTRSVKLGAGDMQGPSSQLAALLPQPLTLARDPCRVCPWRKGTLKPTNHHSSLGCKRRRHLGVVVIF